MVSKKERRQNDVEKEVENERERKRIGKKESVDLKACLVSSHWIRPSYDFRKQ